MLQTESLPLFDGLVNPSVPEVDEERLSAQCLIIFKELLTGAKTNVELVEASHSMNLTARISDVRREVEQAGWNLKRIKCLGGGVHLYQLQVGESQ